MFSAGRALSSTQEFHIRLLSHIYQSLYNVTGAFGLFDQSITMKDDKSHTLIIDSSMLLEALLYSAFMTDFTDNTEKR